MVLRRWEYDKIIWFYQLSWQCKLATVKKKHAVTQNLRHHSVFHRAWLLKKPTCLAPLSDFYFRLAWSLTAFCNLSYLLLWLNPMLTQQLQIAFLYLSTCHLPVVLRVLILALTKRKLYVWRTYIITPRSTISMLHSVNHFVTGNLFAPFSEQSAGDTYM